MACLPKYFAECLAWHSAKYKNILPSAPIKSTRQSPFADKYVAEWTLPSAKRLFAECKNNRQSPGFQ
jgi:hypothetical protein